MIEIHLDGKPVTKLQAARAVAIVGGEHVDIGEPDADGWIQDGIALGARWTWHREVQRPELGCGSFRADTVEEMRQQAQMITLAAEIAELAMMIAAEQVTDFVSDSRLPLARCQKPSEHDYKLAGSIVNCDTAAHHAEPQCADCDQSLDGREVQCISAGCPSRPAARETVEVLSAGEEDDVESVVYLACGDQVSGDWQTGATVASELPIGSPVQCPRHGTTAVVTVTDYMDRATSR